MPAIGALALALIGAALMGFANHRGSTCLVAAVAEAAHHRRAARLLVLAEASLWALVFAAALTTLGARLPLIQGWPVSGLAVAGGILLGLGAWLNNACIFGTVVRIGSRDFHYLLTPLGFFVGVWLFGWAGLGPDAGSAPLPLLRVTPPGPPAALAIMAGLAAIHVINRGHAQLRLATIAIVACHLAITAAYGAWTYSDAIAGVARGRMVDTAASLALFAAVLAGAVAGGAREAGRTHFASGRAAACLAGGALMGMGAALVPGGNDSLLLQGLPALQPAAIAALATMVATIAVCIAIGSRLRRPPQPPRPASSASPECRDGCSP